MTAKPAQVLGLNRGILDKGMPADINVFHLENLQVHADFQDSDQFCTGFDSVCMQTKIILHKSCNRMNRTSDRYGITALDTECRIYWHDSVVFFVFEIFCGEKIHLINLFQRTW